LTILQDKFIEHYTLTGNATKAAIEAGYSEKTAKIKGSQLKAQFANEIREATQDKVPAGLRWLSELAEKAESESVRLGAVRDLLDRAGLKPVERIETTTIEAMSNEEIQRELDALLKH